MLKKTVLAPFFFLLLLASQVVAMAQDSEENAFYALSSLRFHLEKELRESKDANETNTIAFDAADIKTLFQRAKLSQYKRELKRAENYYWQSTALPRESSYESLTLVKRIVDEAWSNLNPINNQLITKGPIEHRYILPEDHWLQGALDEIFTEHNALANHDTFDAAGFDIICKRTSKMIVAKHNNIPGYLVKAYLHCDKPHQTWKWMCNRCEGAENIRKLIVKKNLKHFVVPDKWIYRLPTALTNKGTIGHLYKVDAPALLVVTHMNIGTYEEARDSWKYDVTKEQLKELYIILSHGFASCYLILNIPKTKEGKFACLDTEIPYRHHNYDKIYHYLSPDKKIYWESLVKTGGRL